MRAQEWAAGQGQQHQALPACSIGQSATLSMAGAGAVPGLSLARAFPGPHALTEGRCIYGGAWIFAGAKREQRQRCFASFTCEQAKAAHLRKSSWTESKARPHVSASD